MDADHFDTFIRALSIAPSRRRLLQSLVAALVGEALGLMRVKAADCPGLGIPDTCHLDDQCASCGDAVCQDTRCVRPTGGKCRRGRECASGRCSRKKHKCRGCPTGETACGGRCVTSSCEAISPTACESCNYLESAVGCPCCAGQGDFCQVFCHGVSDICGRNEECCSGVCTSTGKCACTVPGGGCVHNQQCCSRICQPNGRCAEPCPSGRQPCNGVCCASNEFCYITLQVCACARLLCDGVCCPSDQHCASNGTAACTGVCCPSGESCQPPGICTGGVGG